MKVSMIVCLMAVVVGCVYLSVVNAQSRKLDRAECVSSCKAKNCTRGFLNKRGDCRCTRCNGGSRRPSIGGAATARRETESEVVENVLNQEADDFTIDEVNADVEDVDGELRFSRQINNCLYMGRNCRLTCKTSGLIFKDKKCKCKCDY